MIARTWPYGTTYPAVVIQQIGYAIIVEANNEGFVLFQKDPTPRFHSGHKGKIVFTKGGPTGGHWEFFPDPHLTTPPSME